MPARIFHVPEDLAQQPLSTALAAWLSSSDPEPRKLVRTRRVQVNGNVCVRPDWRLRAGDVVKVLPFPSAAPPKEADVRIVHLDDDLVVVDKPAGLTTMEHGDEAAAVRGRRNRQPTLLDLVPRVLAKRLASEGDPFHAPDRPTRRARRRGARLRARRPKPPRVFPVHRLDRDTSGLIVFARSREAKEGLARMLREHDLERVYLAIVRGNAPAMTIESFLADDRGDGRRGSVDDPARGKRAVTHVRPSERIGDYTLVECRLETGRTHQIRIHLSERGFPLCGDRFYRTPLGGRHIADDSGAPRLALHAAGLSFEHPVSGSPLSLRAPLPPDLSGFLERLRATAQT